ncbi:MAG: DUF3098 domain-containing protein [Bacteroidaceae bacterium]|nr:DUF3098 domain-containing protein [Bacteroidaceae bacterium]
MDKNKLAFGKTNFIVLAIGMAIVIFGFILMSGAGSTATHFDSDIFSFRRIRVAPLVCLVGFITIGIAVMLKPKTNFNSATEDNKAENVTTNKVK